MAKQKRVLIKPKTVDVGRGPQPARVAYKDGGAYKVLPEAGAMIDMAGPMASFWQRRINEGAVEIAVEQPRVTLSKKASAD